MNRVTTVDDGTILWGLLADGSGDILLKTDRLGFIIEGSPSLEQLDIRLADLLVAPHLADLALGSHADALRRHCADVLQNGAQREPFEFPAIQGDLGLLPERWFSLTLRPVVLPDSGVQGCVAILRAIEAHRRFESELLAASLIDQLTGLANRQALGATMSRMLAEGMQGSLIVFGIDRFRAVTLRYGASRADEVLWAFGQFLRTVLGEEATLARMEGEKFAAILTYCDAETALEVARDVTATFSQFSEDCGSDEIRVTASAGVAAIAGAQDDVLAAADLSLTLSQAAGGGRADLGGSIPVFVQRSRYA